MAFKKQIDLDLTQVQALAVQPCALPEALYLRCFENKDEQALLNFYRQNADIPFFGITPEFKGNDVALQHERMAKFIDYYKVAFEKKAAFHYGLFEKTQGVEKLVGRLGLTPRYKIITLKGQQASESVRELETVDIVVFIDQSAPFSYGKKGYTKAAVYGLLNDAYQNGHEKVDAVIHKQNARSIKFFKGLGFDFPPQKRTIINVQGRGRYYDVNLQNFHTAHGSVPEILRRLDGLKKNPMNKVAGDKKSMGAKTFLPRNNQRG